MDYNYLLHGPDPETLDSEIDKIIDRSNVASLIWPLVFEKLSFEDFIKFSNKEYKRGGVPIKFVDLCQFMDDKNANSKFIIIKNINVLAHASENTEHFYECLLGACNYYTNQLKLNFILTCVRIPRVFINGNQFIAQWKVMQYEPELTEKDKKRVFMLQHQDIYGRLFSERHYVGVKETLKNIKDAELVCIPKEKQYSEINRQIRSTIEAFMEYESDIYFREEQTKVQNLPLEDIDKIKEELEKHIFGQAEAIQRVVNVALMFYGSKKIDDKPRQIFLFVGPSGVGKTELCRQLKEREILPDYRFLQINLAEHKDEHAVNKLIGVGRGYKDSESGGILTEPVRRYPKQIILFDELDHAHDSILQLFYKIFEGTIQDGRGRDISFRDCFIFMTTNKGISDDSVEPEDKRQAIEKQLIADGSEGKQPGHLTFTQAFLGRINWIVQFNSLSPLDLIHIAEDYFKKRIVKSYMADYNVTVEFIPQIITDLIKYQIFNVAHLFYEIWAFMASRKEEKDEQGARRLYQYMDELLIYPMEYFRLRNKKWFENGKAKTIHLSFKPFLPDIAISYDHANILLIDDDKKEVGRLQNIIGGLPLSIEYADFDQSNEILKHASSSAVILLDLLQEDGKQIGMSVLEMMKKQNISLPISIYTSMPAGSGLDQLRADLWKYKIFQYINKELEQKPGEKRETKDEGKQRIRDKICSAIQAFYIKKKYDVGNKIIKAKLKPPEINEDDQEVTFTMEYKIS